MSRANCAGLILAAGSSSRWRAERSSDAGNASAPLTKVLAPWHGEALIVHCVRAAQQAGLSPLIVVTGFEAQAVTTALRGYDVSCIYNKHYMTGMASSLQCGRAGLGEVDAACILLADMPFVSAALLRSLVAAFWQYQADAVVPVYAGQRGNPVVVGPKILRAFDQLSGDQGARGLLRQGFDVREYGVDDPAVIRDVDVPAVLDGLLK
jgi:molybdenum cofactor cytidylyltransferase